MVIRKVFSTFSLLLVVTVLSACGYLIQPNVKTGIVNLEKGSYKLDPTHTTVLFKINHMGMSTFVGRFDNVDATLEFDPKNMANARLSAIINIASINVNSRELEETLRGSSWFDAEKYPQAFFKTISAQMLDESRARFSGELTLHGITSLIEIEVNFNGGGTNMLTGKYTLGFSAITSFKRSTYAIDYLIPAIADKVDVEIFAEFQKQAD
ncbi:MAG: YceI family protein [Sphingobacteriales bacterium]|nr:MAG: YceI family protein [Sphingobacteriales bacterium]